MHRPTVGSYGGRFSYEGGYPVRQVIAAHTRPGRKVAAVQTHPIPAPTSDVMRANHGSTQWPVAQILSNHLKLPLTPRGVDFWHRLPTGLASTYS